jgi:DNA-binding MarR family transcriptional regulator
MNVTDLRTLMILEKVDNEGTTSQRDLARDLNISLGLVNSFIKRLAGKGFFKIGHRPKNRIQYILTSRGIAEKSRLTYEYIQHSLVFYKDTRKKMADLYIELEREGVKRIIFYGAGELAEIAYLSLHQSCIELVAVVDDGKAGNKFLQFTVIHPEQIQNIGFDKILITTINSTDLIVEKLANLGIPANRVVEIG